MAQYKINVDSEILHQLFLGNSQDSGVAALLESVLNQILQAQASEQLGAELYERTDERQGYRNGTYPRNTVYTYDNRNLLLSKVDNNGNELSQKVSYVQPHTTDKHQYTGANPYDDPNNTPITAMIEKVNNTYDQARDRGNGR